MIVAGNHAECGIPGVASAGIFQVAVIAGHQQHDIIVANPDFREVLVEQLAKLTEHAESIEKNRAALVNYIDAIDRELASR